MLAGRRPLHSRTMWLEHLLMAAPKPGPAGSRSATGDAQPISYQAGLAFFSSSTTAHCSAAFANFWKSHLNGLNQPSLNQTKAIHQKANWFVSQFGHKLDLFFFFFLQLMPISSPEAASWPLFPWNTEVFSFKKLPSKTTLCATTIKLQKISLHSSFILNLGNYQFVTYLCALVLCTDLYSSQNKFRYCQHPIPFVYKILYSSKTTFCKVAQVNSSLQVIVSKISNTPHVWIEFFFLLMQAGIRQNYLPGGNLPALLLLTLYII